MNLKELEKELELTPTPYPDLASNRYLPSYLLSQTFNSIIMKNDYVKYPEECLLKAIWGLKQCCIDWCDKQTNLVREYKDTKPKIKDSEPPFKTNQEEKCFYDGVKWALDQVILGSTVATLTSNPPIQLYTISGEDLETLRYLAR